jgi:ubiquinone/menaquinone biosynthesis C-methylase UbiE
MTSSATPDFGRRVAARYDELRPLDENWWQLFGRLVELCDLRGRTVLDVGCGTGRLAAALAERCGCSVTGVDPSPDMLAVAAERVAPDVTLVRATAEALPFEDATFEHAVLWLVAHHLDRPAGFRELLRVVAEDGLVAIVRRAESERPERFVHLGEWTILVARAH